MSEESKAIVALENLIKRQEQQCEKILQELVTSREKTSHWAWWIFPTELPGMSEPAPKTFVNLTTARCLLEKAEETGWSAVVIKLDELIQEKGIHKVLPHIDHGRVQFFVEFWAQDEIIDKPKWLLDALDTFKKAK